MEVHHILPQSEGESDTEDNAAPLCPNCHELYGANPIKRKFIREIRDFWYDHCAHSEPIGGVQLRELCDLVKSRASKSDLDELRGKLLAVLHGKIENGVPNSLPPLNSKESVPTLGELLGYLTSCKFESYGVHPSASQVLYSVAFKTTEANSDFDLIRDAFLRHYGEVVAKSICGYLLFEEKFCEKGMTEPEINRFMHSLRILMSLFLLHEDIERDYVNGGLVAFVDCDGIFHWRCSGIASDRGKVPAINSDQKMIQEHLPGFGP